uniref:Uncharacterized protein n=1 Tax=Arion vulgaris TaxID=1028688 RepID=A0A0B7BPU6_9EUPU
MTSIKNFSISPYKVVKKYLMTELCEKQHDAKMQNILKRNLGMSLKARETSTNSEVVTVKPLPNDLL